MNSPDITSALPDGPLPLLALRNGVLFPGVRTMLPVGRERSVALIQDMQEGALIGIAVQRERDVDVPALTDLHPIGVLARIERIVQAGPQQFRILVVGLERFKLERIVRVDPWCQVEVSPIQEADRDPRETQALLQSLFERLAAMEAAVSGELREALATARTRKDGGRAADLVASALGLASDREAEVLLTLDVNQRLRLVHQLLGEAEAMADIKAKVDQEVRSEFQKGQREAVLRQQLKAIQKELGEGEDGNDLTELRKKLDAAQLPEEARKVADRELKRLESMGPNQPEYHVNRRYLEFMAELPWSARAEVKDDIDAVAAKLDQDHFGLTEVKQRIVEHIAVRKLAGRNKGTLLCLVGPPGVGKTSLGQSIADATGRPFIRAALGGIRDEAEIRGHRRTYVGALPGRILTALRKAGRKNPVLLLDEIDKLTTGWMGSPEAALLEVLDPEQNGTFTDAYLDLPFDLSEVLFICTANTLDTISPPLRDRLEVIEIQGYTVDEKARIAQHHLIPKRLAEHGLPAEALVISDPALASIAADYTRESGVRQLDRELVKICRAVTLEVARQVDGKPHPVRIEPADLQRYLGKVKFFNELAERTAVPGVAVGLAWTPTGGDILFIETSRMQGKGGVEITGQLGDVMKESARAALSYIRSHAAALAIDPGFLESQDIHIHVPAGAIPKDGPSAGVTIFTALTSLLSGRLVRSDTAMTGECTLRGRVLPVGGIKGKVLAAHRAGIKRIILPAKNERDLDEVPAAARAKLEFIFAEDMSQVLAAALEVNTLGPGTAPATDGNGLDPAQTGMLSVAAV